MNWRSSESASQPPRLAGATRPAADPAAITASSWAWTTETVRLFGGSERRHRARHRRRRTGPDAAAATGYRSTATPGRPTPRRSAAPLQNGGIDLQRSGAATPAVSQGNGHHAYAARHSIGDGQKRIAGERLAAQRRVTKQMIGRHGNIAKARAGKPRPSLTFGQVTTITAPLAGTWSRFAMTSI
jgi:hypothetical protein